MKASYFAVVAFVMISAGANYSPAHVLERPLGGIRAEFHEPHKVVEIYFQAVGRGELTVFDRTLNKSMLTPVSVEYVYRLDSAIPRVKVYAELKQPIPVPGQESCKLRGVSAILDADGRIVETEAHIWPE